MNPTAPNEIFKKLEKVEFKVSPYLQSRVLAELDSRHKKSLRMRILQSVSLAGAAFAVAFFLMIVQTPVFSGKVDEAMAIRVDISAVKDRPVAQIEIDLPEGVYFYSENHPQFNTANHLKMEWAKLQTGARHFPFIIRAQEGGDKTVSVRFLDENKSLLTEKQIRLNFVKANL